MSNENDSEIEGIFDNDSQSEEKQKSRLIPIINYISSSPPHRQQDSQNESISDQDVSSDQEHDKQQSLQTQRQLRGGHQKLKSNNDRDISRSRSKSKQSSKSPSAQSESSDENESERNGREIKRSQRSSRRRNSDELNQEPKNNEQEQEEINAANQKAQEIINQMKQAYQRDQQAIQQGKSALQKFQCIDEITPYLYQKLVAENFIENKDVQMVIVDWLNPIKIDQHQDQQLSPALKIKFLKLLKMLGDHDLFMNYSDKFHSISKHIKAIAVKKEQSQDVRQKAMDLVEQWYKQRKASLDN